MFVEGCPFDHISLQSIVNFRDQLERQCLQHSISLVVEDTSVDYLEYGRRRYAMAEKIVELGADDQDLCRRMLNHNVVCYLRDERFPVRWRYQCFVRNSLTVYTSLASPVE